MSTLNLHLTTEGDSQWLISRLESDGIEVEKVYDGGKLLYACVKDCKVFINTGVVAKADIHDHTYSRTIYSTKENYAYSSGSNH